ncbi:MAG: hypothetical protein KDC53_11440 [Saprospiraceae bacterium]|nr:hypothetical protein [Saprospiraceae bacterium]
MFCFLFSCSVAENNEHNRTKKPICGVTLVAPPRPFSDDPMLSVKEIHCNWIAIVPYAFTPRGVPEVRFGSNHQWWGESPEGVKETIVRANLAGMKTMLKPQVWSHGWWTGDYHFDNNEDWMKWEEQYTNYILFYAAIADSMNVDLFCLGTEFKASIKERPKFWFSLIDKVRKVYHGRITYAANWDNFTQIPFWNELDFIGINAYFPLVDHKEPNLKALESAWKKPLAQIRSCHQKFDKPVIFTEYGYLSVDGAAFNTWELEGRLDELAINEKTQAIALDALHSVFSGESYWEGGFVWKWYPGMQGHEGYPMKDYTPQGKSAEKVLKRWFSL